MSCLIFAIPAIWLGSEYCIMGEKDDIWIFEPYGDLSYWFYYKGHIYKIRDPVEAGVYFNSKTFRFRIDEKKLRHFLNVSWRGRNWTFSRLEWCVESYFPEKVWDFGEGKGVLDRWEDIDGFIKVVKEWLTGRGGKPIFDLEGEIDLPVEERYREELGENEHVKAVARYDIDRDGEKEVVIATAVDKDWRSLGYVYIWRNWRLSIKYEIGTLELYDEHRKRWKKIWENTEIYPGHVVFVNLNQIGCKEIVVFWVGLCISDFKRMRYFPVLNFTIFSFDNLERLCDPMGKLKKLKEEYKKSGRSKDK